jgi:hypothetical protein
VTTVFAFAFSALPTKAQTVLQDDFESYADTAALQAAWTNGVGVNGGIQLSSVRSLVPANGTNSAKISRSDDRSVHGLPVTILSNDVVHARITLFIFASNAPTGTTGPSRVHAGAATNTINQGGVAIGWFNNATAVINGTADVFAGTNFQGRHPYVGGNLFFNLNNPGTPTRAQATNKWIKFDIERLTNGASRYYVNDILGRTVTNTMSDLTFAIIGFGAGTQLGDAWIDGYSLVTNHPFVVSQPTNQFPPIGGTANFSVVAADATSYQWRYNVTNDIVGANSSTLTINNVQTTNVGFYSVVVSNANGVIGSQAAQLVIGPPTVASQTTNLTVLAGGNAVMSVSANGAPPLAYQWLFANAPIAGATTNSYTKLALQPADGGNYALRISNSFSVITSAPVVVTVVSNTYPDGMTLLWKKLPGDYPWLTASGNTARGMTYNALSNHVLVVSRQGGDLVHVVDGTTGDDLYTLDPGVGVIGGGTFVVNMIGVGADGAIYVGNLTQDGTTAPFNLYRYADDAPSTVPTIAYSGDPGSGVFDRWGDALVVRGEGTNTQVLLPSRTGTNVAILTTTDGVNFSATTLHPDVSPADLGLGVAFGIGNTFWGKSNDGTTNGLYKMGFDLNAPSITTLQHYTNFPTAATALGANLGGNLLGTIAFERPPNLRLYDISNPAAEPFLVDWEFFTSNNVDPVNLFPVGNVAFGNNKVYALANNNGLLAMNLGWPKISFTHNAPDLVLNWVGLYTLQSATNVTGPYQDVAGPVTSGPYTNSTSSGESKFFRLRF